MGYKLSIKVIQGAYFGVKKTTNKSNEKVYLHFILK